MTSAADVAQCDRCRADIVWTITANGIPMAINAAPDEKGNTAVHKDVAGTLKSRGISKDRPTVEGSEWLGMPHVATCAVPAARRSPRQLQRPVRRAPWRPR